MILVTGSTGLTGSHLLCGLLKKHGRVRALRGIRNRTAVIRKVFSLYYTDPDEALSRIEWVNADLRDKAALDKAMQGIAEVYHAAAMVSFRNSQLRELYEVNVGGTANLVQLSLSHGVRKLIHVSSVAAFGEAPEGTLITEETPWQGTHPDNHYALSKKKGEDEVMKGMEAGLNAVILNPSVIIGPGDWNGSTATLFRACSKGMMFAPPGIAGYVDVKDLVHIMQQLMESNVSGEKFIVNAEVMPIADFLRMTCRNLNAGAPRFILGRNALRVVGILDLVHASLTGRNHALTVSVINALVKKNFLSNEKIRKQLGFEFRSVEETVRETARVFLEDHGKTP